MKNEVHIIADYRESQSGIPKMLEEYNAKIKMEKLYCGDYLINEQILVERKTAEDFIQSIILKRLFQQCVKMKNSLFRSIMIIEGNPYKTNHDFCREAIHGALISISLSWQLPLVYSHSKKETVNLLLMAGKQCYSFKMPNSRVGKKPKHVHRKQLYALQGFPDVGPGLANRLLQHFGSIKNITNSTEKQLRKVKGIGWTRARKIYHFVNIKG